MGQGYSAAGIPRLVAKLQHGSTTQRARAALALSKLSSAGNRKKIAAAGAIPPLVELIRDGNEVEKANASEALWDLSLNDANKGKIALAGAIEPLVALAKDGNDVQKENAAGALYHLSTLGINHERITSAGGILPLVVLVRDGNKRQKEKAAGALSYLSASEANQEKIASAGGIPPLVELVREGNDQHKEKAAGALWNLSAADANKETIASAGGIPPLVALVRDGNDSQKEAAVLVLRNLSSHDANTDKIAAAGAIPPLVELVTSQNEWHKVAAAEVLRNLSSLHSNKAEIEASGGISALVAMVKHGNDQQQEKATGALWYLAFENADFQKWIIAERGAVDLFFKLALHGTPPQRQYGARMLGIMAPHLQRDVMMGVAERGGSEVLLLFLKENTEDAEKTHEGLLSLQGFCLDDSDAIRDILQKLTGHVVLAKVLKRGNRRCKTLAGQLLVWLKGDFIELFEMCQRVGEAKSLCRHVLDRLKALQDSGGQSVSTALSRLRAVLVLNVDKPMAFRLVSAGSLADTLADLHREIDSLELQPSASANMWQPQWEIERDAMMQKLFDSDISVLVNSLTGPKAQEEVLTLLVHAVTEGRGVYTKQQRCFLKVILHRLASFSALGIPVDEKWFIPRADVQFEDESFNGGAFGKVYHGKYMSADVVIKSVDIKSEGDRQDFLREVNIWHEASRLPNIVQFFGACHVGEPSFMVCKYIAGGSLPDYLYRHKTGRRLKAWQALLDVTHGLRLLHSKGIVHGDLKENNILMEGDTAMLTDFGMSFFGSGSQPQFDNLGAIRWRAPEFIATKKASFEADVYSLGMCIVEAVTGKLPWGIVPDLAVKWHLDNNKFLQQPKSMSDDEWALVRAMCHFDPSKRMQLAQVEKRLDEIFEIEAEKEDARARNARAAS